MAFGAKSRGGPSSKEAGLRERAEAMAATLPPLLVQAERIAATVEQGVHGRRRVGQGDTFWQFRRYQAGDPVGRIDWRQSAKADPVFVRESEWAAAQTIYLWRDASASMRWRSARNLPEKIERADLVTLALAALLLDAGERVALLGVPSPPLTGHRGLERLAMLLQHRPADQSLPPDLPLPRHAELVLIGDFLSPLATLEARFKRLADRQPHGHILQLLDPAEQALPFTGRIRFEGTEEEGEALIGRVEAVRQAYAERLQAQLDGMAALARMFGWSYALTTTDRPPEKALLALYRRLGERVEVKIR
jgi:uncharacterized protein (DUF58 family)